MFLCKNYYHTGLFVFLHLNEKHKHQKRKGQLDQLELGDLSELINHKINLMDQTAEYDEIPT